MKRPKLLISVIVLAVIVGAAVYVNFRIYDIYSPSVRWSRKALAKIGTKLSGLEQQEAEAAQVSKPQKGPVSSQSVDANQPEKAAAEQKQVQEREGPKSADTGTQTDANEPAKTVDINEPARAFDANDMRRVSDFRSRRGFDANDMQRGTGGFRSRRGQERLTPPRGADANQPGEPNEPVDPNKIMEAVNLKDMQMKDIVAKLADWTGKVIIPNDEAMKQKITIYAPKEVPRPKALSLIYSALRTKGFVAEESDGVIYLKPIKEALFGSVPLIAPDKPLAAIANKSQIAQRYFLLKNYSATNMSNIILPMVGEHGYVSADEDTGSLLIIDTVENLLGFERLIRQFDVPEAEQTVTEVFQIQEGDPAEIVQILKILLGVEERDTRRLRRSAPPRVSAATGSSSTKPAASVVIAPTESQVVLIPEPKRKWIIAKASPDDMKRISEWISRLDKKDRIESEYETIPVRYVDAYEVGDRINRALQTMPGSELKTSVLVTPLRQAKQIMVFGRKEMREMVKKLIEEVDVLPSSELETRTFKLEYADPEQIKKNLDDLYGEGGAMTGDLYYYYRYGAGSSRTATDEVKVIAYPTMKRVTVIASPANLEKIEKQIEEWDIPIDTESLKPRIIPLKNTDPVQMTQLLSRLFSEEAGSDSSLMRYFLGSRAGSEEKKKIVGPLYGQLTFEAVPDTKKIIVISKIPEAYKVIEELIAELDKQEMAEVPEVVTLKYADPEDLAVRLNAIFNEPGVTAPIWFRETGLSEYSMGESQQGQSQQGSSQQQGSSANQYTPPWSSQRSSAQQDKMPISNVIGRIRFIPDPHSKSLLVLSPPEFMDRIIEMIEKLDKPGKQVMIKAIIVEVDHSDLTSLGLQLSTHPTEVFGALGEDAVTAITRLAFLETYGSLALDATADITTLIDFLVKRVDAKILNQQTLWTKDNEEARFFKGDNVAFQSSASTSETGGRVTSSFEFEDVGMTLQARPSITPEKNVDMIVNVMLSQLTGEIVNGQPVRSKMETQTNMIVQDSQTIMLGGILFQKDSQIRRKMPLLGDIPGVGLLFRHNETVQSNSELIVFITPYVVDAETSDEAKEELKKAEDKLRDVINQLNETIGKRK